MPIAIFDNDVLVNIFDDLYTIDRGNFKKAMYYFQLRFSQVWIPETVKREFLYVKKRRSRLDRVFKNYSYLANCPIRISKTDIELMLDPHVQEGEADGILQTQKAPNYRKYSNVDKFIFISNDKKALEVAANMGIDILPFTELRDDLREGGIII